jgi:uncharacterized C2H2 Zn-finger protein
MNKYLEFLSIGFVPFHKNYTFVVIGHLNALTDSQMVNQGGGLWRCVPCGIMKRKTDMRRHIEANHLENTDVHCDKCGKNFKTRDSMRKHACSLF